MRIVSFFPKPLPKSIIEGLKETAQIVYWSDLNDNERKNLSDVEVVISNPPVKFQRKKFIKSILRPFHKIM